MTSAEPSRPSVALLGTGTMGLGMAHSVLRAGLPLRVWNRDGAKAAPLADDGATVASSAEEAIAGADVVVTMVFDAEAVLATVDPAVQSGAFTGSQGWLQTTTVGLEGTRRLSGYAAEHGLSYVDAPVLGTKKPAEDGILQMFCAGPSRLRPSLEPVLDALGSRTVWLGEEPGSASALKLVCNAWIASITDATAQSVALAQGLGVDPQQFLDALKPGPQNSEYAQMKGGLMIKDSLDEPTFALDGLLKDTRLIRDAMGEAKVDDRLMAAIISQLETASGSGHGAQDMAAIVHAYR